MKTHTNYIKTILSLITLSFMVSSLFAMGKTGSIKFSSGNNYGYGVQTTRKTSSLAISEWKNFQAMNGNSWTVDWSPMTGFPKKLSGGRYKVNLGNPGDMAKQFLKNNHLLLGMKDNLSDLLQVSQQEGLSGYHLRFKQYYSGIEVYGTQVSVHISKQAEVFLVNNEYDPNITLSSVTATLSADSAETIALHKLKVITLREPVTSQLVVFPSKNGYRLSWVVSLASDDPNGVWQVFINTENGEILYVQDMRKEGNFTGTGKIFFPNAVVPTHNYHLLDGNNSDTAVPVSAYTTVTLYGLDSSSTNGLYYLRGSYIRCANIESPSGNPPGFASTTSFVFTRSSTGFEWVMVYYHIDQIQRYIQTLGFSNVNNRSILVDAHGVSSADNSWYVSSPVGSGYLAFGDGGVDDAEDAEVIAHEYGHAIQDNQVPGFGVTNEGGAMGEGFGDWLAGTYFFAYSGGFQDVCIADWDATSYSTDTPPCLRRLDSTKHYPGSIDNEVHDDGEMWSATLWSIFNSLGANSTARDTMMKLVLEGHFYLTTNANFIDGASAIVTADDTLFGGVHTSTISTAFYNRGIFSTPVAIGDWINYADAVHQNSFLPNDINMPRKE